jgi:outer membrane lipoprotein-sorting protein
VHIDPTYNFLLRLTETTSPLGGQTVYEVTDVQYNPALDDGVFSFKAPDGAREVSPP